MLSLLLSLCSIAAEHQHFYVTFSSPFFTVLVNSRLLVLLALCLDRKRMVCEHIDLELSFIYHAHFPLSRLPLALSEPASPLCSTLPGKIPCHQFLLGQEMQTNFNLNLTKAYQNLKTMQQRQKAKRNVVLGKYGAIQYWGLF